MSGIGDYSEDSLVEKPAIALFSELGWETANCFYEKADPVNSTFGRKTTQEVVLTSKLRTSLKRLNPQKSNNLLEQAIEQLTSDRSALNPVVASRELFRLVRDGVKVGVGVEGGEEFTEVIRVIDWGEPSNNEFFLASQFWISGEIYKRRADLLGFVNGLPLVLFELKAVHRRLESAYYNNLRDYKTTIPRLFWYTAFIVLSNGSQSRIGSISASWKHFNDWKKISEEAEAGVVSLETMIRGTCEKKRLLDLVENFSIFTDISGPLVRILPMNHQYIGVNNAIRALQRINKSQGRLGVFWHTQGSGKSYSSMFFSQKVLRKISGDWTFLIVTDRQELDDQIYKTFANAGVTNEPHIQATNGEHLKQLLGENHRYIFTLIQKFHIQRGQVYPMISPRSDIIVITDEAHRTQYDQFARNMRNALPNAAFIGFTGTPLLAGEEKTRQVFGDYVSIYNFRQSIEDGATVPLYYENRIPELQLRNKDFTGDMERLLDDAELDERQERKLEHEFAREYELITRNDRQEKIANDIVSHFIDRGYLGKAMVVCIDKATTVRMYDKVRKYWRAKVQELRLKAISETDKLEREKLSSKAKYMEETDMAVVVSQAQNEVEDLRRKSLDITSHRKRMLSEDLDKKFKDPEDPFRIAFVCAMWMTGFDVPSCSTIYLDKPMRNHSLMQTIARANRVFEDKVNGLIVDYVGVFRNLQNALAIYGSVPGGDTKEGETPAISKDKLVEVLRHAIESIGNFCHERGVDLVDVHSAIGFERIMLLDDAVEAIIVNDESMSRFLSLASDVLRLYKAILPDRRANDFTASRATIAIIAEKIRTLTPDPDVSGVLAAVEDLLDESVRAEAYEVSEDDQLKPRIMDLSKLDFVALTIQFEKGRRRIESQRLRAVVERNLSQLVLLNQNRMDFYERYRKMIDEYNAGAINVESLFQELLKFAQELTTEEHRGVAERLTEEELAIFDLLMKPDIKLTEAEKNRVKKVAKELLETLKQGKLVLDWRKRQQTRAEVMVTIENYLDHDLPDKFTKEIYSEKCQLVYEHVYDSYLGEGASVYQHIS